MILKRFGIPLFACGLLAWGTTLRAQSPEASIVGTVKDPSGAWVPGAHLSAKSLASGAERETNANGLGEFRFDLLPPGRYHVRATAPGFQVTQMDVALATGVTQALEIPLAISGTKLEIVVRRPLDTATSVVQTTVSARDIASIPLAARSFANIAYFAPMTQPVEPSDPTKARITAVSFAGSSGLNVDLSVDGGDNNDDYIGGFLQNVSPDAIEEFTVRTAQFDADTSRTNGGSVIITTRRGNDQWHGSAADYFRAAGLNARNTLDNPEPNPKQPFSRNHLVGSIGGPIVKEKLWFFSAFEYVDEDASISYSNQSLAQFQALAQLASMGLVPGVNSIGVPSSVPVLFRDSIFSTRIDWRQSDRSQWFLRVGTDRYHTANDLIQQATLPSTGAYSR
jgi:hypothetical protein